MVRWISHLHHGACYWVDVIGNILSWKLMCEDFSDCHTCLSQFQSTSQFSFLLPPFKMICQRTNALSVHARVVLVPGLSHISSSRFSGSQRLLCSDLHPHRIISLGAYYKPQTIPQTKTKPWVSDSATFFKKAPRTAKHKWATNETNKGSSCISAHSTGKAAEDGVKLLSV